MLCLPASNGLVFIPPRRQRKRRACTRAGDTVACFADAATKAPAELQRQRLIFASVHVRRTLLRNVLKCGAASEASGRKKEKKRKQNKNKTQVEEEEEIMSDLNEELLAGSLEGESWFLSLAIIV